MSALQGFKKLLHPLFRMEEELEIVSRWELSFAEVCRLEAAGKLPDISITFPLPEVYAYATQPWESIYLASLRYGPECSLMIRPFENRAAYELLLVRHG